MFSRPDSANEGPGTGTALADPPAERVHFAVLPGDMCDRKDCKAKVQVAIEVALANGTGSLGFCAHDGARDLRPDDHDRAGNRPSPARRRPQALGVGFAFTKIY